MGFPARNARKILISIKHSDYVNSVQETGIITKSKQNASALTIAFGMMKFVLNAIIHNIGISPRKYANLALKIKYMTLSKITALHAPLINRSSMGTSVQHAPFLSIGAQRKMIVLHVQEEEIMILLKRNASANNRIHSLMEKSALNAIILNILTLRI